MERIWRGYIQWKMYTVRNTWCLPVFLCMSSHRIITNSNTYYMEPCNGRRSKPQLQVNHPGWSMVKHVTPHWFHGDYCHPILASPSLIEGSHNGEACRVEAVSDGRENCVWTLVCAMKTVNPSGQSRDSIASCSSIFIFFLITQIQVTHQLLRSLRLTGCDLKWSRSSHHGDHSSQTTAEFLCEESLKFTFPINVSQLPNELHWAVCHVSPNCRQRLLTKRAAQKRGGWDLEQFIAAEFAHSHHWSILDGLQTGDHDGSLGSYPAPDFQNSE